MYQIAVANNKGGVGKTTTSVALATLLSSQGSTLLVDADEKTRGTLDWNAAGPGLPCDVLTVEDMAGASLGGYEFIVLDTKAGEDASDMLRIAQQVDLLIVPTKPDPVSLRALVRTLTPLIQANVTNYRVLIVDVPPAPSTNGHEARRSLMREDVPVFARDIRRTSAFEKAALAGLPVGAIKGDRYAKLGHMDYELVLDEILKAVPA